MPSEDDDEDLTGDPYEWRSETTAVADAALVRQLATAWRRWFDGRPEPVGLLGQLLDITHWTDEGRAGKPAAAVGVSAKTWNRWLLGARGIKGGSTPSAASRRKIAAAVRSSRIRPDYPTPTTVVCRAVVVWNRYQNGRTDPLGPKDLPDFTKIRTVRFEQLDLDLCRESWEYAEDWQAATDLLEELERVYGVPIELYEAEFIDLED